MKRLLIVLMLIISGTVLVLAEDDQGNPNDPNNNDRANACYEDGTMAGKCDTEWEWQCGWYLIRFENGEISRENFPVECASLLPQEVEPEPTPKEVEPEPEKPELPL